MKIFESEGLKYHCIQDETIMNDVLNDIKSKYKKEIREMARFNSEDNQNEYFWDPGGMVLMEDQTFEFKLDKDLIVSCRSQHWFEFKNAVRSSIIRGSYSKLYGYIHILCMSTQQRDQLLLSISEKEAEYDVVSLNTLEVFEDKVSAMKDYLIRKPKKENLVNKNLN